MDQDGKEIIDNLCFLLLKGTFFVLLNYVNGNWIVEIILVVKLLIVFLEEQ